MRRHCRQHCAPCLLRRAGAATEGRAQQLPKSVAIGSNPPGSLFYALASGLAKVISEASRFIPSDLKAKEPTINWRGLADLGNWLRHAYHRTDADLLWAMVENDLEPLKNFVERLSKESKL